MILTFLNLKKAPGFTTVTGTIFKKLQRKGLVKLTTLIKASIRPKHVPNSWKIFEIILILKSGKDRLEVESFRPITLL